MHQVPTYLTYLGNCCTSYVYMSLRVLTLVRIPFTLPYLTDLLGTWEVGRRGKTKKEGSTYVRMNGFFFSFGMR